MVTNECRATVVVESDKQQGRTHEQGHRRKHGRFQRRRTRIVELTDLGLIHEQLRLVWNARGGPRPHEHCPEPGRRRCAGPSSSPQRGWRHNHGRHDSDAFCSWSVPHGLYTDSVGAAAALQVQDLRLPRFALAADEALQRTTSSLPLHPHPAHRLQCCSRRKNESPPSLTADHCRVNTGTLPAGGDFPEKIILAIPTKAEELIEAATNRLKKPLEKRTITTHLKRAHDLLDRR